MTAQGPVTLHEIFTAWQAGRLTTRTAMRLSGIDHLSGLYEAARHSAVPVRKRLLPREAEAAELATAAILARRARDASEPDASTDVKSELVIKPSEKHERR